MATDNRQQTQRRFVRSDDPNLSAEANAALTEELQQAIGAEQPGRLLIVGACVVAGVIVFVSLVRLAVQ